MRLASTSYLREGTKVHHHLRSAIRTARNRLPLKTFSVANGSRIRFKKHSTSVVVIKHRSLVAFQEGTGFSPALFLPTLIEAPYNLRDPTPSACCSFSPLAALLFALDGALGPRRSLCFYCAETHRVCTQRCVSYRRAAARPLHRKKTISAAYSA